MADTDNQHLEQTLPCAFFANNLVCSHRSVEVLAPIGGFAMPG